MRHWEYLTVTLSRKLFNKGWEIDEADQEYKEASWYKKQGYTSISNFCNLMDEMGWELVTASQHAPSYITLIFRRSII
ncbi:MAG TPA: hypothetical protein VFU32_04555 [Ktedonobacterales bacterium]|nr:hypothetical protein [Ktedonobacterales bacterium]